MSAAILDERYRLESCLAIGGMGEVWRGEDLALARPVAVKMLRERYARDPDAPARFLAEARSAGRLCHPGIAKVFDYQQADRPFMVMELVQGPSLAVALAAGRPGPGRALDIVFQVAHALSAAHLAGVIHRDIKPANLLLGPAGEVKITDFGIACSAGTPPLTSTGMVLGTPGYLAPERIDGRMATIAADLYSLGVVLFECLTGDRPFYGTPLEIALAHRDRPLPPLPAFVPAPVRRLVADLTAKDPSARPPSASVVAIRAALLRDQIAAGQMAGERPAWGSGGPVGGGGWRAGGGRPIHETAGSKAGRSQLLPGRFPGNFLRRRADLGARTLSDFSPAKASRPGAWLKTAIGRLEACL
jgi:serine/threonine protein kinase